MKNKFWYLVGCNYEVKIFRTEDEAKKAHRLEEDMWYWDIREGEYGIEFSGWQGSHESDE